jgi:hypothetical protein
MHNRYDPKKQCETDMQVLSFYMKRHHEFASLKHVTDNFFQCENIKETFCYSCN